MARRICTPASSAAGSPSSAILRTGRPCSGLPLPATKRDRSSRADARAAVNVHKIAKRLAAALALFVPAAGFASETDNLTYRFLRLEDSAAKLNGVINATLDTIAKRANERLAARGAGANSASDTEVELIFDRTYTEVVL